MVTFQNHVINLQFQSVSHIDYYIADHENRYGKIEVLQADGPNVVAKYADAHGYISARQSERWSKKRLDLHK